jgi:hypothetical protein
VCIDIISPTAPRNNIKYDEKDEEIEETEAIEEK